MPSNVGTMAKLFEEAIFQVDSFLRRECGARRFADEEARAVEGRSFAAGWQLTVETPLAQRRLNVYVDHQFPLSVPRFVVMDRPPFPAWPHVEEDGLLCLSNSGVRKFRQPENVIGELLQEAYRLIRDCESGANENDFRTEFYSYWNRVTADGQRIRSLLEPHGPSRIVHLWRGETRPVVGESEQQVLAWLRKWGGNKPQFDNTDEACLLWIDKPLLPREYPNTAADLYRLAGSVPGGKELLHRLAKSPTGPFYFLIGAESGNGPCLAAIRTTKPVSTDVRGKKRDRSSNGFRPGRIPASLQAIRLFSSGAPATRLRVERVDAEWIHGRGHDPRQKELQSKTVILFGCGSVGAPLGHQLAMAGVGRIILVDPEKLTWANVGRHPLGADHVDSYKAVALAEIWQKAYPHAQFEGFAMASHDFLKKHPELVSAADLLVCAVADWKAELELSLRQQSGEIGAPVLYAWTEPNACAGHAVVLFPGRACLQCGFEVSGESKLRVTEWPEGKKEETEPACGAIFQPYGPIELLGTISVAARLALDALLKKVSVPTHRVWAGPERLLLDAGGVWSAQWINGDPNRRKGAFEEERVWEKDPRCGVCGGGEKLARRSFTRSDSPPNVSLSAPPS
jgi:sulfur-carrier protein adenylyltransferase/sulfurtransferase